MWAVRDDGEREDTAPDAGSGRRDILRRDLVPGVFRRSGGSAADLV